MVAKVALAVTEDKFPRSHFLPPLRVSPRAPASGGGTRSELGKAPGASASSKRAISASLTSWS